MVIALDFSGYELWLGPRGVLQIYGESEVQMGS